MEISSKFFSMLLHLLLLKSSVQSVPVRPASYEFYVENARFRRQAGYVYNRPNISFDLPSQAVTVTTQAPNVDRTQAQQMYYAYPVPAGGGDTVNIGYSPTAAGSTAGTSTPTAFSASSSAGYNDGAQGGGSSSSGGGGNASGGGGYNYGAQGITGGGDSGASGYNYGAQGGSGGTGGGGEVTSVAQTPTSTGSSQASANSGSSQSVTATSGYNYNTPKSSVTSPGSGTDVSTNAPKYLPPTGNDSSNGNVNAGSLDIVRTSGTGPAVAQQPSDSYIPSLTSINMQTSSGSTGSTNTQTGTNPSPSYIPPSPSPPFSIPGPGKPSTEYLPPLSNQGSPPQGTVFPPSSTYLPPVF